MPDNFTTTGSIELTTYINLDQYSWGISDLLVHPDKGVELRTQHGSLRPPNGQMTSNLLTLLGQRLVDLLSEISFVKSLQIFSGHIWIKYKAEYEEYADLVTAVEETAQVIAEFDKFVSTALVSPS